MPKHKNKKKKDKELSAQMVRMQQVANEQAGKIYGNGVFTKMTPADFNPELEAEQYLEEIEVDFPESRCSLRQYRDFLEELQGNIRSRINQLDEEIG